MEKIRKSIASLLVVAIIISFAAFYKNDALAVDFVKEIELYSVASYSPLSIPSTYATSYQITLADLGLTSGTITQYRTYDVTVDGELYDKNAAQVDDNGLITPGCYYYKDGLGTSSPQEGYTYTYPIAGYSDVRVTVEAANNTVSYYHILVHHYNYGDIYAESVIDQFIADNITPDMSIEEIVTATTKWIAESFDYGNASSAYEMITLGYGDCFASTDLILLICKKCGINAWARSASKDFGAGSNHRNAMVEDPANEVWYVCDAGYQGTAPRMYEVLTRTSLYCYRVKSRVDKTCEVYQLDVDPIYADQQTVIEVPSEIDGYTVIKTGLSFLENNSIVKKLVLPDTVTTIGERSLCACYNLSDITLPSSVTTIEKNAFASCTSLKSLAISSSVTSIGVAAFFNCKSLDRINIPSSVTAIEEATFKQCVSLGSVSLPAGLTSIGAQAFGECSSLTDVYFAGTEEQWNTIEIGEGNDVLDNVTIHFNSDVNVNDPVGDAAVVVSKSLDLNGKIGVNFKLTLPDELLADRNAYIDINGTHYSIPSPDSQGRYSFSYYCAAAEMRDDLVLTVHRGDGSTYKLYTSAWHDCTSTGFVYKVDDYIQRVSSDTSLPYSFRNLVDCLGDYGKQAQIYFDYNTDAGSFSGIAGANSFVTYSNLVRFNPSFITDSSATIQRKSSQLELNSATTLIHNFTLTSGNIDDYVIKVDGKEITTSTTGDITLKYENGMYRLKIENIAAAELQISHKVEVIDGSGKTVIKIINYSALSYIYTVLRAVSSDSSAAPTELVELLKYLYRYNRAAMNYWGISDPPRDYGADEVVTVDEEFVDEPVGEVPNVADADEMTVAAEEVTDAEVAAVAAGAEEATGSDEIESTGTEPIETPAMTEQEVDEDDDADDIVDEAEEPLADDPLEEVC